MKTTTTAGVPEARAGHYSKLANGFYVVVGNGKEKPIIEGGWDTSGEAQEFADSEVSGFYRIVHIHDGFEVTAPATPAADKATARPWVIDDKHIHCSKGFVNSDPRLMLESDVVCEVNTDCNAGGLLTDTDKANMALIVKAVNAHDELVAALRLARNTLKAKGGHTARERDEATAKADAILNTLSGVVA